MMFNNLIESSSHTKEYKRRGSFFLLTTATYAVLLLLSAVASIYAYDARLEDQIYQEVVTMLPVPEPEPAPPVALNPRERVPADNNRSNIPERAVAMPDVNRPDVPPEGVSVTPNKVLPLPPGIFRITGRDTNPMPSGGGSGTSGSGGTKTAPPKQVILEDDPPPPPPPPANKIVKISKVLNSQAILLPKPNYPPLARQIGQQGTVTVQVLIDETGKVISAQSLGGPPLLTAEAKKAALQARFSPTMIGDQPVKVSGVITYNFRLN